MSPVGSAVRRLFDIHTIKQTNNQTSQISILPKDDDIFLLIIFSLMSDLQQYSLNLRPDNEGVDTSVHREKRAFFKYLETQLYTTEHFTLKTVSKS